MRRVTETDILKTKNIKDGARMSIRVLMVNAVASA
jgi:hypothetical protein